MVTRVATVAIDSCECAQVAVASIICKSKRHTFSLVKIVSTGIANRRIFLIAASFGCVGKRWVGTHDTLLVSAPAGYGNASIESLFDTSWTNILVENTRKYLDYTYCVYQALVALARKVGPYFYKRKKGSSVMKQMVQ